MPIIVDGVEIPVEVDVNEQAAQKARESLDGLIKRQNEQNKILDARKEKVKKEAEAVKAAEAAKQKAIQETTARMNQQREKAEKLVQVGTAIAAAGAAVFGGLVLAAKNYADKADAADQVAQRWKATTDRVTDAQMKLGRAVATELNPAYEQLAEILERVSNAASSNRTGTSAVIGIGASLLAGGTILATMAKLSSMLAGLASVTGSAAVGGAATAIGAAALPAAVGTLAVTIGGVIGKAIGDAVNDALGQQRQSWGDILETAKKTSAIFSPIGLAAQALKQAGFAEAANKLWEFAKWMNGIKSDTSGTTPTGRAPGMQLPDTAARGTPEAIEARKAAAKAAADAQKEAEKEAARRRALTHERNMKLLDAQKEMARKEADIRKQMSDYTAEFLQSERDAYQDYYNKRSDMARQAGIDAQRAEEDHQKRIRDILRRGNERVTQAAQARDALALVRARRETEQERQDEESNYRTEAKRRNQDFAERIREMDRDFAIERQRRTREYEFKMKAYQAEVTAAQMAYQAIVNAILQVKKAASTPAVAGMDYYVGSRGTYRDAASSGQGGSGSGTTTANINVSGGAMNMAQVRAVVNTETQKAINAALGKAFAV